MLEKNIDPVYKSFFQRVLSDHETTKQQVKEKVNEIFTRYKIMEKIYREEHLKVLELSDNIYHFQLQQADNAQADKLKEAMEKQKIEYKEQATKQGQRRKELEDQLMAKDTELKKLKNEAFENNRLREEVASLRTLVQYYKQNSSQTSR